MIIFIIPKNSGLERCRDIIKQYNFTGEFIQVRGEDVALMVSSLVKQGKKVIGITGEDLYREFILESVNNFLFQGQLKTRRYLFNGYLYLEDETHFFNQLLALLPNMQRPWSYNDHIAIMTAFNRLQEINSISSEFTSIHSQQIELSILLWEKLKIFTETLLAYPQDEQWDLFKQSEKEYLNKFEQIMDMGEEVIRRLNQDSNKQICSLDFRQPCVTNDSTIS